MIKSDVQWQKFENEDHSMVHKTRHEMTLSLGAGPKNASFTDQTPTPTQFFRNCEEVGLFQDLQNVNPFEETFKKAVEAVKSGQPLSVDKSFQANSPDDTLHTPNIFPHITDIPSLNPSKNSLKSDDTSCKENLLKQDILESNKICSSLVSNLQPTILTQPQTENVTLVESICNVDNQPVRQNKAMLNISEGHFVQLMPPGNSQNSCMMVVIKNSVDEVFAPLPVNVKEKLKKNLNEKKLGKYLQQKVPILKCPAKKTSNSVSNKFSKFSKNAVKSISNLENSNNTKSEVNNGVPKKQKKNEKLQSKESRSEFLARSRAASSRCREKKKLYILYLEKVNNELSTANENLQFINKSLHKEICQLHKELLKHKNCSAADENTELTLVAVTDLINERSQLENLKTSEVHISNHQTSRMIKTTLVPDKPDVSCVIPEKMFTERTNSADPNAFYFDVAEVILDDHNKDIEIPLNEGTKSSDIIVRFNSVGNYFPSKTPPDPQLDKYIESAGDEVKQIYYEHSYFFKKPIDIDKRIMNYKTFSGTIGSVSPILSDDCKKLSKLRLKKNDTFRDITSLSSKALLEPRTPPPLLLLKPFKKRSLQSKHQEKTS